jgi:integrase
MRPERNRKTYVGRVYLGQGKYHWVGRFPTRKARDAAVARARVDLDRSCNPEKLTCREWVGRYLARYELENKASTVATTRSALNPFLKEFGDRPIGSITRLEALDWAGRVPVVAVARTTACLNAAVDLELLERNPVRGLTRRGRGRADVAPPTEVEFNRLLDGCAVHGPYAQQMRSLILFMAYSGVRPGEAYALEWADVDIAAMRVDVRRRVYAGRVDTPKSGRPRRIALTPVARDALLCLPHRDGLVFRSKGGKRLSSPTAGRYWRAVCERAGLDVELYLACKHRFVHHAYCELELSPRAIAEQCGWRLAGTIKLLEVYGHHDIGALAEIDKAFSRKVAPLRAVE